MQVENEFNKSEVQYILDKLEETVKSLTPTHKNDLMQELNHYQF